MRAFALSRHVYLTRVLHFCKPILINLGLISIGSIIFVIGMNSVLIPNKLLSGGLVGMAMILHYLFPPL